MTTKQKNSVLPFFVVFLICAGIVENAFAAGTPAGTVIQSRSRAIYSSASGASIDTVFSSYVSIKVLQVGSVNILPVSGSSTTNSDSTVADYAATITNSGNGADVGKLSSASSKGWTTLIYRDVNNDGILQTSEENAGTISQTNTIAADGEYKVIIRVRIPRDESLDGMKDTTSLIVKSNYDSTKTANGGYTTTVRTAKLFSGTGLAVNIPNPKAGSQVTYTYTYTNNGSVPATGMMITNLLPPSLSFVSATTSQGTFNSSANPIVWNIGTVAPGGTITVTLIVKISTSVTPGTVIGNPFVINYTVGSNNYSIGTNPAEITVGGVLQPNVEVTALWKSLIKEATDTAVYRFRIRNSGTVKDVFELNTASTLGFTWMLYRDANNNAQLDITDPQLTNSNGIMGIDVDSLTVGDSVRVFARAVVSRQTTDQIKDSLTVTAVSSKDNSKTSTATTVTTINVPVVSIHTNVFPVGNQPAGSVITYTITYINNGSASVNNFSVVDQVPQETDYMPNSIKVNGSAVADNTGPLTITDDNGSKIIAVNIGTLSAGQSGSVEFKVKIK